MNVPVVSNVGGVGWWGGGGGGGGAGKWICGQNRSKFTVNAAVRSSSSSQHKEEGGSGTRVLLVLRNALNISHTGTRAQINSPNGCDKGRASSIIVP